MSVGLDGFQPSKTDENSLQKRQTEKARMAAASPAARAKRTASLASHHARRREIEREDVAILRRRGYVPMAIADTLGLSDRAVNRYLREPGYKGRDGAKR
jgi:hypothetical protein